MKTYVLWNIGYNWFLPVVVGGAVVGSLKKINKKSK